MVSVKTLPNVGAKQLASDFTDKLKALFQERLLSVCLYGSGASDQPEEAVQAKQNINLLVIIRDFSAADLVEASAISKAWEQQAQTLPIFLSESEWHNAADIFALEYADIRQQHWVAYGKDVFSSMEIHGEALRLICELEIYRKLIFLRQRVLLYREQPEKLWRLMQESVSPLAVLLRGVIRFYRPDMEASAPMTAKGVYEALPSVIAGFDNAPFQTILTYKQTKDAAKSPLNPADTWRLYQQFLEQICVVNDHLNTGHV